MEQFILVIIIALTTMPIYWIGDVGITRRLAPEQLVNLIASLRLSSIYLELYQ